MQRLRTSERLFTAAQPISAIEDNFALTSDGGILVGYELTPPVAGELQTHEIQKRNESLVVALGECSPGTAVTFVDAYGEMQYTSTLQTKEYFNARQAAHFEGRKYLQHHSYMYVCVRNPKLKDARPDTTTFAQLKAAKSGYKDIPKRKETAKRVGAFLVSALSGSGVECRQMSGDDIWQQVRCHATLSWNKDNLPTGVNKQMTRYRDHVQVGTEKVHVISMVRQGYHVDEATEVNGLPQNFIYPLCHDLHCPHVVVTTLKIEDRQKVVSKLETDRRVLSSMHYLTGRSGLVRRQEMEELADTLAQTNLPVVSLNVTVLVHGTSEKKVHSAVESTCDAMRSMSGCQPLIENIDAMQIYLACFPGGAFNHYRNLLVTADQALCYVNLTTPQRNEGEGIMLCSRERHPVRVPLFNKHANNRNGVVVGPSGSGKTVFALMLVLQRFIVGTKQVIIDVGGSYKNLTKALRGTYISQEDGSLSTIPDPFHIKDDQMQYAATKISHLVALIGSMWKQSRLGRYENNVLTSLLDDFYKVTPERNRSITGFSVYLRHIDKRKTERGDTGHEKLKKSFGYHELITVLEPFVSGLHKDLFSTTTNLNIKADPLVVFDLTHISDDPLLEPVITLTIISLVLDQIRLFPEIRKFIYMDEAWKMLKGGLEDFIGEMYRTIRKNNGSMNIITQTVDEIVFSDIGPSVLANSSNKMILQHTDKNHISTLTEAFGLSDFEKRKVQSLQKPSFGREIFIKQDEKSSVYLVEVDPEVLVLCSSAPHECTRLNNLIHERGGDVHAAVKDYIKLYQS